MKSEKMTRGLVRAHSGHTLRQIWVKTTIIISPSCVLSEELGSQLSQYMVTTGNGHRYLGRAGRSQLFILFLVLQGTSKGG